MSPPPHRELILPNPQGTSEERPRGPAVLALASGHVSWLELHRRTDGSIRYFLGAPTTWELSLTSAALQGLYPGSHLGAETTCPIEPIYGSAGYLLRAVPRERSHFWPLKRSRHEDRAGTLVRTLAAPELRGHELVLQLLFRGTPSWESTFLSGSYDTFIAERADTRDRELLSMLHGRKAESPFHVEIRAGILGSNPDYLYGALQSWLGSWTSSRGNRWWWLMPVKERHRDRFMTALRTHDIIRFHSSKPRRNVSGSELACVLPIPWRDHHPELRYVGAPAGNPPPNFIADSSSQVGIVIGQAGDRLVRLPPGWNHVAILGKTRTGKSTLALNIACQILEKQPKARVIVLEPAGALIEALIQSTSTEVLQDCVEIDPAHPTFTREAEAEMAELVSVPLNLLHLSSRRDLSSAEFERRAERLTSDLLQSIKNAWGEESIGGRAEFVLRAVIQGLLSIEGTNLVDAYSALSDKKFLARLEQLASGTQLKHTLRTHLPKLDYSFTISSLDKVGKVAANPLLRKALCQRYHPVSFEQLIEHRLLLVNLAKSTLGTETSTFLGAILLTQLWSAIQERPPDSPPIYLIVDEFHNFAIPAFADMLSEGARHGLHVVAITQYLSRVPPRIHSALVGNVDSWILFGVGAEDARDVSELAQAERFGWKAEHFSGGLAAHEAALSVRDCLLKIDTLPPPPPNPNGSENREIVRSSSRRYAAVEDSEVSPLDFSRQQVLAFLHQFTDDRGRTPIELAGSLHVSEPWIRSVIALQLAAGNIAEGQGANGAEYGLRARGFFYREALDVARNEGEEHCSLLADAGAFLRERGIHMRVVRQEGGYLRPDAEFDRLGRTYSVEVECSMLAKHLEQVARNIRKAVAQNRRCLVVVGDRENAELFTKILAKEAPSTKLWAEVGLVWRVGAESMIPCDFGHRKPWEFLPGGIENEEAEVDISETGVAPTTAEDSHAADLTRVSEVAQQLLATGKWEVTALDFEELFRLSGGSGLTIRRFGMAMASLKVTSRRVLRNGSKVRIYDIRTVSSASHRIR